MHRQALKLVMLGYFMTNIKEKYENSYENLWNLSAELLFNKTLICCYTLYYKQELNELYIVYGKHILAHLGL